MAYCTVDDGVCIEFFSPVAAVTTQSFDVEPDETSTNSTHTWKIESADFGGACLDVIEADYGEKRTDFASIGTSDVTVELTNDGNEEPSELDLSPGSEFEFEPLNVPSVS